MNDTTQNTAETVTSDRDESYESFILAKVAEAPAVGFEPPLSLTPSLFPHQRDIVRWACLRGRAAPRVTVPACAPRPIGDVIDFGAGVWSRVADRVEATRARVARGRRELGCDRFVMPYNGSGSGLTGRSLTRPLGTVTAADRWAVVDGDTMRMLTVAELRAAMGFPSSYVLPEQRCHATQMLGNAIVPAVAAAAVRAVMEAA